MNISFKTVVSSVALLLAATPGMAAPETAEAAARAYLTARAAQGFRAIPDAIHPDAAERFKAMVLPYVVADDKEARKYRLAVFGPEATRVVVNQLPPVEFMRQVMANIASEWATLQISPGVVLGAVPEGRTTHVLVRSDYSSDKGASDKGSSDKEKVSQMEVLSFQRAAKHWRLLLPAAIESTAWRMQFEVKRIEAEKTKFGPDESAYMASVLWPKQAEVCATKVTGHAETFKAAFTQWQVANATPIETGEKRLRAVAAQAGGVPFDLLAQAHGNDEVELMRGLSLPVLREECSGLLNKLSVSPAAR